MQVMSYITALYITLLKLVTLIIAYTLFALFFHCYKRQTLLEYFSVRFPLFLINNPGKMNIVF